MSGFIPVDRQTAYLFPPSVEDWLPEDHLARFIVEVIDRLDLSELTRQYEGVWIGDASPGSVVGSVDLRLFDWRTIESEDRTGHL